MDAEKLFELDRSRCVKCGLCAKDCFFGALRTGASGFPEMAEPGKCMRCQHCLAICPQGAVAFGGRRSEDSPALEDIELPGAEAMENFIRSRRSVRRYQDGDVDRPTLERILKALGNSPTGCNARSLKFTCIPTRRSMDAFREKFLRVVEAHREGSKLLPRWLAVPAIQMRNGKGDVFFRNAPGMLIVSSDETAPGVTTPHEDVVIACAQFELLAQAHGLGTCWCGFLKLVQNEIPELLSELIGFRPSAPFYAMLFGRPAVSYRRGVQRDGEATVEWVTDVR
jgi:nitroreductase/NAD-dependent dihydropyrimidine dehydrogenase PreA subunit